MTRTCAAFASWLRWQECPPLARNETRYLFRLCNIPEEFRERTDISLVHFAWMLGL